VDAGQVLGKGIAFPPRVGPDGRVAWSEGEQNIRESIEIILRTEERERLRLPEFGGGLRTYLFEPNTTSTWRRMQDCITKALSSWEPRIVTESVDVGADPDDGSAAVATIDYRLVATQAASSTTLTLQLET
jgi:phage baseplate assembly protein W